MKNDDILKLNLSGWPLSDAYLIEIGRVTTLWAGLESQINACIGQLAGFQDLNNPIAFILVNHSSFPQRLDMLAAICELLVPMFPNLEGYDSVVQKLRQAQKLRNDFMHHAMAVNPGTGNVEMVKGTARGKLKVDNQEIALADLRRASVQIHEAQIALFKLVFGKDILPIWERQ